jgi:hypothetical protein
MQSYSKNNLWFLLNKKQIRGSIKKGKFFGINLIDLGIILLIIIGVYIFFHKDTYFEVKRADILGASATYMTLQKKGFCVDVNAHGHLATGDLISIKGRIIDGTKNKLYVFDGTKVWVLGKMALPNIWQVYGEHIVPADLVPLTLTIRAVKCTRKVKELDVSSLDEINVTEGFIDIYGLKSENTSTARLIWLSQILSKECSGEVYIDNADGTLVLLAKNILPKDVDIIKKRLGDLLLSHVLVKKYD